MNTNICLLTFTLMMFAPAAKHADVRAHLVELKAKIMSADYRADVPALTKLREDAATMFADPEYGHIARYWAGFANWRAAMNGASLDMKREEMRDRLVQADIDFDAAIAQKPDFVDGIAAVAGVNSWLWSFYREDNLPHAKERVAKAKKLIAKAKEMAPDNPRVLWVDGGNDFFTPPAKGGDQRRAFDTYYRALAAAPPADPKSPMPDWGRAELLMSLAYAHLNGATPDPKTAESAAKAALALQPEWSYVRDVLMPKIAAAEAH